MTYKKYLLSKEWQEKRKKVFERALKNANSNNEYNIVIYIDGNQTYTSGTGSVNDPYVYE